MNLVFLVLWVFALPFPRLRPLASSISAVWACIMVVCKMLYQLKVIKPLDYSSDCRAVSIHADVDPSILHPHSETIMSDHHLASGPQSLVPSNNSGLENNAELGGITVELLNSSILYSEPVDPVHWWGALRKCEGSILPCLQVQ